MTTTTPSPAPVAVNDIGSTEEILAAVDETIKYFDDGDIVEGTVVKVDRDEVLLDIGYKTEGVILARELSIKHDVDPDEIVSVGDEIEALVLQKEDKEGRMLLSKKRAQYERAWGTIERIKEEDGVVTGSVIEVVKGGLILDIGLRGFLPASLVEMRRVRDLQPYVGRELEAKIIELDKNRNNVVLSRRAWLEQTQSEVRTNFLQTLQKGQVRSGVVSSIVNFGAFVDLGGVDGLVHVSELSWKHIDHPSEVVEVGNEVTVEVLDVDFDRERVSLSLKATQEDPWQAFARTHAIGQVVPFLGLNTLAGYSLALMGGALGQVWLIKGTFDTIPRELDEAAIIDGCTHWQVFRIILLPTLKPIIATTFLLAFVGVISEFLLGSIILTDNSQKTLAVGLYGMLVGDRSNNLGIFAAGAVLTMAPVIALFQYLQRYIVGGSISGAVKG